MAKEKLGYPVLLRMDKDTKTKLVNMAKKMDRSLNWVLLNLIKQADDE